MFMELSRELFWLRKNLRDQNLKEEEESNFLFFSLSSILVYL